MKRIWLPFFVFFAVLFSMNAFAADKEASGNFDKITDFTINKINDTIDAVKLVAPQVTEMAVKVTQVEAEKWIIIGFALLAVSIILFCSCGPIFWRGIYYEKNYEKHSDKYDGSGHFVIGGIGLCVAALLLIPVLANLLNYWNWVGVYHPDILLSHNLLEHVLH